MEYGRPLFQKVLGGTGILPVRRTGWKPVPPMQLRTNGGHGGPPHQPFNALRVDRRPMSNCLEKSLKLVAQAFQPVSRKQVSRTQPGKAVPPVNTSFSCFTGGPMAHARLLGNRIKTFFSVTLNEEKGLIFLTPRDSSLRSE
ncbi:MAG: hypothetical protein FJ121_08200 [Deltaproteobacteria bacterium]|nr:hypothetical protein [Deltaproteobacteria bacterium]